LDAGFLRASGGRGTLAHMAFLVLVVVNLVAGFQVMGTLMVVGMMMLPAAAARFWQSTVGGQIVLSAIFGIVSGLSGLLFSYHYNLPASPAIILAAGLAYLVSVACGPQGGLLHGLMARGRTRFR